MAGNFGILKEARTRRFLDRGLKPPENIDYDEPSYAFSGFLLRSGILQGWPGLEVRAFRIGGPGVGAADELAMLRLDRVAADTLFGVVDGQIGKLEITQPPEGLHFAVGGIRNIATSRSACSISNSWRPHTAPLSSLI